MSRWLPDAAIFAAKDRAMQRAKAAGRVTTVNNMLPEGEALGTRPKPRGRPRGGGGVGENFEPEAVVLRNILKYLEIEELSGRVRWSKRMNSGAVPVDGNRFVRFGFSGCPDIMLQLADGRVGWIEVKSARGRATAAQDEFLCLIASRHTFGGIARNLDDCMAILEGAHLPPRKSNGPDGLCRDRLNILPVPAK